METERTEKRRSKRRVSDRSVSRRPSLNLLPFISSVHRAKPGPQGDMNGGG